MRCAPLSDDSKGSEVADVSRRDPTVELLNKAHEVMGQLIEAVEQLKAAAAVATEASDQLRAVAEKHSKEADDA